MPIVLAVLVALLLGAAPARAAWTPPDDATRAGRSFAPSVALDRAGHLVVGWTRHLRGVSRVELRQGTGRQGLRSGSTIVFRDGEHAAGLADLAFAGGPGSPVAALFRRHQGRSHRAALATVAVGGRVPLSVRTLSGGGESAYGMRFSGDRPVDVGGDGPTAFWSRRTFSEFAHVGASGAGPVHAVPPGVTGSPAVARQAGGALLVAWAERGDVRVVRLERDGALGPVHGVADDGGYAREPQIAARADGSAHLVWLANAGSGNAVRAAPVDAAGTPGASIVVAGADQRARDPEVAVSAADEGVVAWLSTGSVRGWGSAEGVVRLQRLRADGTPIGDRRRLSPGGVRTFDVTLMDDDPGGVLAGWSHRGPAADPVYVRRLAPGGILGRVRRLAHDTDALAAPALAASATGAVVAAWEDGGRIWVSRRR